MKLMAEMLANMPDLRFRVQSQHIPDQNGFCADCRGNTRWPCDVSRIAQEAERHGGTAAAPWAAPMPGTPAVMPPAPRGAARPAQAPPVGRGPAGDWSRPDVTNPRGIGLDPSYPLHHDLRNQGRPAPRQYGY